MAAGPGTGYQQTPDRRYTFAVGSTGGPGAAPQARVIAGSPYAAFCSAPAVTGRRGRSRTESGRRETSSWQAAAVGVGSGDAVIGTGVVACGAGDGDAAGAAGEGLRMRYATKPATRATGSAIRAAHRAALRAIGSATYSPT